MGMQFFRGLEKKSPTATQLCMRSRIFLGLIKPFFHNKHLKIFFFVQMANQFLLGGRGCTQPQPFVDD